MITNVLVNGVKYLEKFLSSPVLDFFTYSFSRKVVAVDVNTDLIMQKDMVAEATLHNFQWNNVSKLFAANSVLIAQLDNGDSLIISRKEYEKYATEIKNQGGTVKLITEMPIEPAYPGGPEGWPTYVKQNILTCKGN